MWHTKKICCLKVFNYWVNKTFYVVAYCEMVEPSKLLSNFQTAAILAYKPVAYKKTCVMTFKDINLLYEDKVCSRKFPYFLIFPILKFSYCKKMSLKWKIKSEK